MTFKELKAAVKGRFMKWGKYTAEKLENVSGIFDSTTTEDVGKVLTVGEDGSPEWEEAVNPLPPVTSGDNGDVLSVVNGAWAKSPAPSSLPPYTSADKGKVLTIGEGSESETVVIVPEQTVEIASGSPPPIIEDADTSYFVVGQDAVMTINGTDYDVTAIELDGVVSFAYVNELVTYQLLYLSESGEGMPPAGVYFASRRTGEYTLSLNAVGSTTAPEWKAPSQSMIYYETNGSYFDGLTVGKAAEMVENGKIPFVYGSNGMMMLTRIVETSSDKYSVYYNFSDSATDTNLAGNGLLPYAGKED